MSAVLLGLVGVIAGALATTGTELLVTSRQRRNDALAASRLVWGGLEDATGVVDSVFQSETWGVSPRGMERAIAVWEENRLVVARSVDNYGYRMLEFAFRILRETVEQAGSYDQAGFEAVRNDERLPEYRDWLRKAQIVARRAGQTTWERVLDSRRKRKREAEEISELAAAETTRTE